MGVAAKPKNSQAKDGEKVSICSGRFGAGGDNECAAVIFLSSGSGNT